MRIRVGRVDDIKEGKMIHFEHNDKDILITNIDGKFYAMDNVCTHAGASLHEGKLDGNNVTCPWHGAVWDLTTGKLVKFPVKLRSLECYNVRAEDNTVYIDI